MNTTLIEVIAIACVVAVVIYIMWRPGRRPMKRLGPDGVIKPGDYVHWKNHYQHGVFKYGPLQVVRIIVGESKELSTSSRPIYDVSKTAIDKMPVVLRGESFTPAFGELEKVMPGDCPFHRFQNSDVMDLNADDIKCIHCGTFVEKISKDHPHIAIRFDAEDETGAYYRLTPVYRGWRKLLHNILPFLLPKHI